MRERFPLPQSHRSGYPEEAKEHDFILHHDSQSFLMILIFVDFFWLEVYKSPSSINNRIRGEDYETF
ncbi:MAG: hypothetical protein CVU55_15610 [Deltaproteobacteria bacterium HGW-Deltaproteobacteria-13]|jgi:hypothetical protein|nr:MAG: hypothetical protein CVU55_15610 [Deltaproteobacteria bacterium HGW-Deltaproteobacteria-13]